MTKFDHDCMKLAIAEAFKSKFEDNRVHPFVGAVVAKNKTILAVAHRGELAPGNHAEFTLLELREKSWGRCLFFSINHFY
jgi:pyrimidine deaminase RibD-like protein